jgi:hypothetical protein
LIIPDPELGSAFRDWSNEEINNLRNKIKEKELLTNESGDNTERLYKYDSDWYYNLILSYKDTNYRLC